jgi:hypothetical protein
MFSLDPFSKVVLIDVSKAGNGYSKAVFKMKIAS